MDSLLPSSTSTANAEATPVIRERSPFPGGLSVKQDFSLPSSIIYYITKYPSTPKGYNKLIQTCKYFFKRNPILIASAVTERSICSNDKCCNYGYGKCCVKIDIIRTTSKFWLTRELNLFENFAKLLNPKIYRCDIIKLFNFSQITLEFDDFKLFALSAKEITLKKIKIVGNNGIHVMLENILEELPNVQKFCCEFPKISSMVSASTAKNMSKLKNLGNLKNLYLYKIPQVFCLDDFYAFMKDHSSAKFAFTFADNISDEYKNQLDQIIDSVIENPNLKAYISYCGHNQVKQGILWKRFIK